jgi:hypothetical protein
MSAPPRHADLEGCPGRWEIRARGGIHVGIAWDFPDDAAQRVGTSIVGKACEYSGGESFDFALAIASGAPQPSMVAHRLGSFEVTLALVSESKQVTLDCSLPLSSSEFFSGPIGQWRLPPIPPAPPVEPPTEGEAIIDAPQGATDVFPFIWTLPPSAREIAQAKLRFARLQNPDALPLYEQLKAISGTDAPAKKRLAASDFISSPNFVGNLSQLALPERDFPALRVKLMALEQTQTLEKLTAEVESLLGDTLAGFLAGPAWTGDQPKVWQSLFALSLAGNPADAKISNGLVDVLRVVHFLALLQERLPVLAEQGNRLLALSARIAFPDAVAAQAPAPGRPGAAASGPQGACEVLGIGVLKMARQSLAGYVLGELADIVNVLPRERQARSERTLTDSSERGQDSHESAGDSLQAFQSDTVAELSEAINEVMAAEGLVRNMTDVTPSYQNLNLLLSGSWSGGNAASSLSGIDASRFVQRMTEQAAKRLGERVASQRGKTRRELWERCSSSVVDNTAGERLTGVYRWIDRVVRIRLENLGPRLVMAFGLKKPAQYWTERIAASGNVPLQQPEPLPAFAVPDGQGYQNIDASNYQAFGARYGLADLEPPPPMQLTVVATLNRASLAELSILRIPDGYVASSGSVAMGLSDSRYNIVCSVGNETLASYPPSPLPPNALKVVVPAASSSTSVGDPTVNPPAIPVSTAATFPLSQIKGATGSIPITVISAAPLFGVSIEIVCDRAPLQENAAGQQTYPLLTAWQMRTYDRLLKAWQAASREYVLALAARIAEASAGRSAEVQRETLETLCLQLLLQAGKDNPQGFKPGDWGRTFQPVFAWRAMAWQYELFGLGIWADWAEGAVAQALRSSSELRFRNFLEASSAQVLLPVQPGWEAWILFYLQFQREWPGGRESAPLTESSIPMLEELFEAESIGAPAMQPEVAVTEPLCAEGEQWTLRIPTCLLYLQEGSGLPSFQAARR